jgi:hypothetical protein
MEINLQLLQQRNPSDRSYPGACFSNPTGVEMSPLAPYIPKWTDSRIPIEVSP